MGKYGPALEGLQSTAPTTKYQVDKPFIEVV